jgi:hypothetical protein
MERIKIMQTWLVFVDYFFLLSSIIYSSSKSLSPSTASLLLILIYPTPIRTNQSSLHLFLYYDYSSHRAKKTRNLKSDWSLQWSESETLLPGWQDSLLNSCEKKFASQLPL